MVKISRSNSIYVLTNIFVSSIGFVRSFLFMRWLGNDELGIISLVQTIILFVALFQIGLVNGGYRIFALDKAEQQRDINNVLFSYFALLMGVLGIAWIFLTITEKQIIISNTLMLIALVCGVTTLMMNWLTNTLIGKRLIRDINVINLISVSISLFILPSIMWWGMSGAILSLFAQPLVFVGMTLMRHKELRPIAWNFDLTLVKYILSFGFIPFLAGIFVMLNIQIERWSIAEILGVASLGDFYLVFLYSTLFVLIPTSLLNIFFPVAIHAYENDQLFLFKSILKKHLILLLSYLVVISLSTVFIMQPFIDWLLPLHSGNTVYVYYFLPGLICLILCDPVSIILNASVKLKPLLYVGGTTVVLNILLILLSSYMGIFSLTIMAIIKSIVNITAFVLYLLYLKINYRLILKKEVCLKKY